MLPKVVATLTCVLFVSASFAGCLDNAGDWFRDTTGIGKEKYDWKSTKIDEDFSPADMVNPDGTKVMSAVHAVGDTATEMNITYKIEFLTAVPSSPLDPLLDYIEMGEVTVLILTPSGGELVNTTYYNNTEAIVTPVANPGDWSISITARGQGHIFLEAKSLEKAA